MNSFISGNVSIPQSNVTVIWIVQTPRTKWIVPREPFRLRVCLQRRRQLLYRHLLVLLLSPQQHYLLLHQRLQRTERIHRLMIRLPPSFHPRFLQSHRIRLLPRSPMRFLQSLLQLAQNGLPYGGYAS